MKYDFDQVLDRTHNDSSKYDERLKKFGTMDVLPLWVADMDFKAAQPILNAMEDKVRQGVFGYVSRREEYFDSLIRWQKRRNGWDIPDKSLLSFSVGVVPSLAALVRQFAKPGEKVLIQPPVYPEFYEVVENSGCEVLSNRWWSGRANSSWTWQTSRPSSRRAPSASSSATPKTPPATCGPGMS